MFKKGKYPKQCRIIENIFNSLQAINFFRVFYLILSIILSYYYTEF